MRIRNVEFVVGAAQLSQLPRTTWPEIAWAGRSNVGKSSLLNQVVGMRGLARTSNTPGKTRQINFYRVDGRWHLVDLPGYGYASGPRTERESWGALIEPYLRNRRQLAGVAVLVDSRIGPTELDRMMFEWLTASPTPWAVMLTKTDKVSGNDLAKVTKVTQPYIPPDTPLISCSAHNGRGIGDVRAWIGKRLDAHAARSQGMPGWQVDTQGEE